MSRISRSVTGIIGRSPRVTFNRVTAGVKAMVLLRGKSFSPLGNGQERVEMAMAADAEKRESPGEQATILRPARGWYSTEDVRRYDFIDALRGYAILGVLLVHSSAFVAPLSTALKQLMAAAEHGVQLFYIASALTLCLSWQARHAHEVSPIRNFYVRRFFRIAPLFYVAIAVYLVLFGFSPRYWAPNGVAWWFVPLTALFLHGFHPETINSVVPGGWSIAVEMSFYLVLPLILRRVTTLRSALCLFLVSLLVSLVSAHVLRHVLAGVYPAHQQYLASGFYYFNFLGQFPTFCIGIASYYAFMRPHPLRRLVLLGGLLLMAALLLPLLVLPLPASTVKQIFTSYCIGPVFALFALGLGCFPVRLLVNRAIQQLGRISFSMYLSHFLVLHLLSKCALFPKGNISSLVHFLCVLAVTAALSFISYSLIERQGIALGKRLIERLEGV